MKKLLIVLAFVPFLASAQNATNSWEIGGFLGGLNYKGDITQNGDIGSWINEMRPEIGIVLKKNFNYRVALGAEASYGQVFAKDGNHNNPDRNYMMRTEMVQTNMILEINFKKFGKYFKRNASTPFVKVGVGALLFSTNLNANASYPKEYDLYRGTFGTYNFQTAFGWKWRLEQHSILALDLHYNFTGTSYLEGYNLAKGPNPNDAYYGLRLTYTYAIF